MIDDLSMFTKIQSASESTWYPVSCLDYTLCGLVGLTELHTIECGDSPFMLTSDNVGDRLVLSLVWVSTLCLSDH